MGSIRRTHRNGGGRGSDCGSERVKVTYGSVAYEPTLSDTGCSEPTHPFPHIVPVIYFRL